MSLHSVIRTNNGMFSLAIKATGYDSACMVVTDTNTLTMNVSRVTLTNINHAWTQRHSCNRNWIKLSIWMNDRNENYDSACDNGSWWLTSLEDSNTKSDRKQIKYYLRLHRSNCRIFILPKCWPFPEIQTLPIQLHLKGTAKWTLRYTCVRITFVFFLARSRACVSLDIMQWPIAGTPRGAYSQ